MKTLNKKYIDDKDLTLFIQTHNIEKEPNVLLQIFLGFNELTFLEKLLTKLKKLIPHIKIIGTSTCGEILDDKAVENSTILSFSIFEKTKIYTYSSELKEDSHKTAKNLISKFDKSIKPKLAITFTDGLLINGEDYINAFSEYSEELIISGGLAGDNYLFSSTTVFTQDGVVKNGAVVALLENETLNVTTKASFGWENIGKTMTITSSKNNVVYEIDGIKAVDVYAKYLGDDVAKQLPKTGIEFPLIVKRNSLNIPRAVVGKNDDDSLIFAGNLSVGDKVTFGYGNIQAVLDYGENINKDFSLFGSEGIFIYSCMARKNLLQSNIALELLPLSDLAPISGFFTHGEFYTNTDSNSHELLNQTMTILSLSEESTPTSKHLFCTLPHLNKSNAKDSANITLKAFSHLISQTSRELEEINDSLKETIAKEVEKNRLQDQQMLNQSRLAQMGEMIAMIAHQWRQPLNSISLTASNLQLKCMLGEVEQEFFAKELNLIDGYSQHLSKTIDDFRNFFKENKTKETTNLSDIIEHTIPIIKISLESKNIQLITSYNSTKSIKTYPHEVMQVLLNILKNAEDALVENNIQNATIHIETHYGSENSNPTILIRDNAGGIPPDILPKIFDPYFSTKLAKEGTGLGLYMSKIIIEEHCKGRLSVSNLSDGTEFKIEIENKG